MTSIYKDCPHCGKKYHIKAGDICPFCKKNANEVKKVESRQKINTKVLLVVAFLFFILIIINQNKEESHTQTQDTASYTSEKLSTSATAICQSFIETQLKSPASAKHPHSIKATPTPAGNYILRSHVDSQNSFGAMIRAKYICELSHQGGDPTNPKNWKPIALIIE